MNLGSAAGWLLASQNGTGEDIKIAYPHSHLYFDETSGELQVSSADGDGPISHDAERVTDADLVGDPDATGDHTE
jgi:hypothetical protein